jgi:signal transduction histidine kinase
VGGILPLGLVGLWLASSTRRSGEDLLRARLAEALEEVVQATGRRWAGHRAILLDLASASAVQEALAQGALDGATREPPEPGDLGRVWERAARVAAEVVIRDGGGDVVRRLGEHPLDGVATESARRPGLLTVTFPVDAPYPGERLGTLEAGIAVESLVPVVILTSGVGGSVLGVFDSGSGDPLVPLAQDPALFGRDRFEWGGEDWVTVERQLLEPPLRLVMAGPTGAFREPFEDVARSGLIALLLVAGIVALLTTILTRRFTAPLQDLSEAAHRVAGGDLSREATEDGPPEVARTARAFNAMTRSLQRSIQRLSQQEAVAAVGEFAASLAHEVRNPLTSVQLSLERAQRKLRSEPEDAEALLQRALGEVERLNAAVGGSLQIARSGGVVRARIDLRESLEAACSAAEPHFDERGVSLERDLPGEPVWMAGDAGALEQLALNLLLNAADAAASGGENGRSGIALERDDADICVRVWDTGDGIAPEDLDRIFEPFYSTRSEGTGLGLPIARRIARAHGSELTVTSRTGEGTTFSLRLPAGPETLPPSPRPGNGP